MGCPNFFKYHPEALANPEEGLKLYAKKFGHEVETLVQAVEKTEQYQKAKEQSGKKGPNFSAYYFVIQTLQQMDRQDKNLVNVAYENFLKDNTEKNTSRPQETRVYEKKKQPAEQRAARDETAVQIKKAYSKKISKEQINEQDYQATEVSDEFKKDDFNGTNHLKRNPQRGAFTEAENVQVIYTVSKTKSDYTPSDIHVDVAAGNNLEVSLSDIYETISSSEVGQTINLTVHIENQGEIVNPMPAIDVGEISFEPSFEPSEINASSYQTLDTFLTSNGSKVLEYKNDTKDIELPSIKDVRVRDSEPDSVSSNVDVEITHYDQFSLEKITIKQNSPEQANNTPTDVRTEIKDYSQLTLEEVVSSVTTNESRQITLNINVNNYTDTSNVTEMFKIYATADTEPNEINRTEEVSKTEERRAKETVSNPEPVNEPKVEVKDIGSVLEKYALTHSKGEAKRKQYNKTKHNEKYQEKQSYVDESRAISVEINSASNLEAVASEANERRYQLNHLVEPYLDMILSYSGISPNIKTALSIIEEIESYDKKYGAYLREEFFDKLYSLVEEIEKENKRPKKTKEKKSKKLAKKLDELIMKILKTKKELMSKEKRQKKSRKKRSKVLKKSKRKKRSKKIKEKIIQRKCF